MKNITKNRKQNKTENNISDIFKICDLIHPKDWSDALTYKEKSRENNTEGLVIKNKRSHTPLEEKKVFGGNIKLIPCNWMLF